VDHQYAEDEPERRTEGRACRLDGTHAYFDRSRDATPTDPAGSAPPDQACPVVENLQKVDSEPVNGASSGR
jgi:hypothetical protein